MKIIFWKVTFNVSYFRLKNRYVHIIQNSAIVTQNNWSELELEYEYCCFRHKNMVIFILTNDLGEK